MNSEQTAYGALRGSGEVGVCPVLLNEVDSTNAEARRRCLAGQGQGVIVVAQTQSAGRGRLGRSWASAQNCGLWMTLAVDPKVPQVQVQNITLLTAVAVCAALRRLGNVQLKIKWPNDILLQDKKLCGILCETVNHPGGSYEVLLGIGINLQVPPGGFGADIAHKAIALSAAGIQADRLALAAAIAQEVERCLVLWRKKPAAVVEEYRQYLMPAGTPVRLADKDGQMQDAVFIGVDDDGALQVVTARGPQRIISGEISVRGRNGYV